MGFRFLSADAFSGRRAGSRSIAPVENLLALVPSIGVAFLFVVVLRHIVRADRMERDARRRVEDEEAAGHTHNGGHGPRRPEPR